MFINWFIHANIVKNSKNLKDVRKTNSVINYEKNSNNKLGKQKISKQSTMKTKFNNPLGKLNSNNKLGKLILTIN